MVDLEPHAEPEDVLPFSSPRLPEGGLGPELIAIFGDPTSFKGTQGPRDLMFAPNHDLNIEELTETGISISDSLRSPIDRTCKSEALHNTECLYPEAHRRLLGKLNGIFKWQAIRHEPPKLDSTPSQAGVGKVTEKSGER